MHNFTYLKYEVSEYFYFLLLLGPNPFVFNLWLTGFFQKDPQQKMMETTPLPGGLHSLK